MKILAVDDDKMILETLKHKLGEKGHEVLTAENGLKALDIAGRINLDLIILDVIMPDFSGLSLLSMLKQFYLFKLPVIIISSLNKSEIIASSVDLGAADFLMKPINFDELDRCLSRLCK
jgi:DNA-binding response OmpR family regulator